MGIALNDLASIVFSRRRLFRCWERKGFGGQSSFHSLDQNLFPSWLPPAATGGREAKWLVSSNCQKILSFIDDILIYSRSAEEHEQHSRVILNKLWAHEVSGSGLGTLTALRTVKFNSLNSSATVPKTRVPFGFPFWSMITAALPLTLKQKALIALIVSEWERSPQSSDNETEWPALGNRVKFPSTEYHPSPMSQDAHM